MKRFIVGVVPVAVFFFGLCAGHSYAGALDGAPVLSATLFKDQRYRDILSNLPHERVGVFSSWRVDEPRERPEILFRDGIRFDEARRVSPYFIAAVLVVHFGGIFLPDQVHVFVTETISEREKFKINRDYHFFGGELNVNARFPRMVGAAYVIRF